MTRAERLEFIAKLRKAKETARSIDTTADTIAKATDLAGLRWGDNANFAFGDKRYENASIKWLRDHGITAKNIRAVFDNSIAEQEKLL